MNDSVLLITATFNSGKTPFTKLDNTRERVEKYMEGLLAWLSDGTFQKIVLAKNCTTSVNANVFSDLANEFNKEIEFLTFLGSSKTLHHGKGFGEGQIVEYALKNSRLLRSANSFCKITGKLYCPEINEYFADNASNQFFLLPEIWRETWKRQMISKLYRYEMTSRMMGRLRRHTPIPQRLLQARPFRMVDTRVYHVEKSFYQKHLLTSYRRVQDFCSYYVEHAFYDDLQNLPVQFLKKSPVLVGTSGTDGLASRDYPAAVKERAQVIAGQLLVGP